MNNKKIHIYIDESGDTGIKFGEGSSDFFVVCLLVIKNEKSDEVENNIKYIKESLKIYQKELKFSHITFNKKISFYNKIKNLDFYAEIFIYKKKLKQDFSYFIIESFKHIKFGNVSEIKIIIDGMDKNKISSNNIKTIRGIFKGIKIKICFADSRKDIFLGIIPNLRGLKTPISGLFCCPTICL